MDLPLQLPRTFTTYACERSLVCCQHPVRAPVPADDELRVRRVLALAPDGQLLAQTLAERIAPEWSGGRERVWRQRDGRCVNLDAEARACELHRAAGLEALPSSCRNFPRWVSALPDRIEAAFALTCPTAARLLVEDPSPFALVDAPRADWPYAPTRRVGDDVAWTVTTRAPIADALALRAGWWRRLAEVGEDAAALARVLAAMQEAPLDPGHVPAREVGNELGAGDAQTALAALERLPDRDGYVAARWAAFADLVQPLRPSALVWAIEPATASFVRLASQGVQWVGVHDPRPAELAFALVARRVVLAVRLVDALCSHVPYPLRSLLRDAFSACTFVGA